MQTGVPCAQRRAMRLVRKGGCVFLGRLAPFLTESQARSFLALVPPWYTFMVPRASTTTGSDGHAANKTSVPPPRGWSFFLRPCFLPFLFLEGIAKGNRDTCVSPRHVFFETRRLYPVVLGRFINPHHRSGSGQPRDESGSNRRPLDLQSNALPTELSSPSMESEDSIRGVRLMVAIHAEGEIPCDI